MPINYRKDLKKHFVREFGWLKAARRAAAQGSSESLKYLTFCAVDAVDIHMLEMNNLISRDRESGNFLDVYFCERDKDTFADIQRLVRIQGFLGEFEEVVLFEDDDSTQAKGLLDPRAEHALEVRERLRLKQSANELKEAFPFDILNLDFDGSLFPPEEPADSRLLKAVWQIIDWQANPPSGGSAPSEFTLFLTTRIERSAFSDDGLDILRTLLEDNLAGDESFKSEFERQHGKLSPTRLAKTDLKAFCSTSLPKKLLEDAFDLGWKIQYHDVFVYRRPNDKPRYDMLSIVCHFERITKAGFQAMREVIGEATEIVRKGPRDVDAELKDKKTQAYVKAELAKVVTRLDETLAG